MNDEIKKAPSILPHLGAFASTAQAKVAHDLFIAGEFLVQLKKLAEAYGQIRSDAGHGATTAACRFAVLMARGLGMTEGEFFTILRASWGD